MTSDHGRAGQHGFGLLALVALGIFFGLAAVAFGFTRASAPTHVERAKPPAPKERPLSIAVSPRMRVVDAGDSATYTVAIDNGNGHSVRVSIDGHRPDGISIGVEPRSTRSGHTRLTVDTAATTDGSYHFDVVAVDGRRRDRTRFTLLVSDRPAPATPQTASSAEDVPSPSAEPAAVEPPASLPSVSTPAAAAPPVDPPVGFTISGSLATPLRPGLTVPLDLTLTNPSATTIIVTSLDVALASIDAPRADGSHTCTVDDFTVTQFSGTGAVALEAGRTSSLGELGFTVDEWPQVTLVDRPVNQDGCQQASLGFRLGGTATQGPS